MLNKHPGLALRKSKELHLDVAQTVGTQPEMDDWKTTYDTFCIVLLSLWQPRMWLSAAFWCRAMPKDSASWVADVSVALLVLKVFEVPLRHGMCLRRCRIVGVECLIVKKGALFREQLNDSPGNYSNISHHWKRKIIFIDSPKMLVPQKW